MPTNRKGKTLNADKPYIDEEHINNLTAHTVENVRKRQDETELKILSQLEQGIITNLEFIQKINELVYSRIHIENFWIDSDTGTWGSDLSTISVIEIPNGQAQSFCEFLDGLTDSDRIELAKTMGSTVNY